MSRGSQSKITPCPKCGCENTWINPYNIGIIELTGRLPIPSYWEVQCSHCYFSGPVKLFRFRAIKYWNQKCEILKRDKNE